MKVCVYMMTDLALRMEIEDGTNATVQDLVQSITQEEQLRLPRIASTVFTLWMSSGLLELQLKAHHKPLQIRNKWSVLLAKYAHASESRQRRDEPVLSFKRNVFYPLNQEERIKDEKILELLYAEAKYNILEGRYPCDVTQYIMLGSIQARIELGPYNPQYHTLHFFSSAFFQGQIEQPVRGLKSLITHQDIPVLVGINGRGVYIINNIQYTLLVGLKYEELSWDFAKPSQEDNPDCLPCLFLQFRVVENGTKVSKILQIFSKQAVMMDALITGFVEELKLKLSSNTISNNNIDRSTTIFDNNLNIDGATTRNDSSLSFLTNKLRKLTLATFDEEGRCIGQMGSWSFSY
ncbi:FERM domain-containing protein 8-like isoform X2 [Halyomorpha halys]|uniref:FERM domain-containing protein 8-like isoform X2 n=1 Tax=Halyomorpha halys TaxID=286706 RepID=UPI0006D4E9E9